MAHDDKREDDSVSRIVRGVRLDLTIAVCALLISTLAAGASWWQARVLQTQTLVLQEQLGAQVWPYVSVTEGINRDTVQITIANDGLGPAILRSLSAFVDGKPQPSFIALLHSVLGEHIVARTPHGQKLGFTLNSAQTGSVIRPGDRSLGFSFTSERFAKTFLQAYRRLTFRICYCAIVPGKCWRSDSGTSEPARVASCPEIPHDLLHSAAIDEIMKRDF
jgi:hypothetical protein